MALITIEMMNRICLTVEGSHRTSCGMTIEPRRWIDGRCMGEFVLAWNRLPTCGHCLGDLARTMNLAMEMNGRSLATAEKTQDKR